MENLERDFPFFYALLMKNLIYPNPNTTSLKFGYMKSTRRYKQQMLNLILVIYPLNIVGN